ncbi:hypothetical protein MIB92_17330 [Aestuariirhabdus sp. Z084]|uniref:hypothetical protein n=1 Tax=Aestuariirhabdus haliotis TaxID=2918751 RepID=UPI00201B38F2|nr:hypothetical protein [Aestuariirhabdus haliotis]MCL6417426.1 hypothetical protein [Aestuariirhabdus haliotis]MCL6421370.1 hypothetical protein [Aestuariirhabdus haliotis]
MKKIGFSGGSYTARMGDVNDVKSFFYCINEFLGKDNNAKYDIILNRFYRHYLKLEELDSSLELMDEVREAFSRIEPSSVEWDKLLSRDSILDVEQESLADVFSKYFNKFSDVIEDAKFYYEDWNSYKAVKIVIADVPDLVKYQTLPEEEYDSVVGDPLWVRDANGENPLGFENNIAFIK